MYIAGRGGDAYAEVGHHGLCYVWFVTRYDHVPTQMEIQNILKHLSSGATCTGGVDGNSATAAGGNGGKGLAPQKGCGTTGIDGGRGGNSTVKLDRHPPNGGTTVVDTPGKGGNGGPGVPPGRKGKSGTAYWLTQYGASFTFAADGADGAIAPALVGYADLPPGSFCVPPPTCRDTLNVYSDTSTSSSTYGRIAARFVDGNEFATFSGSFQTTQYQKLSSGVVFVPGAVVFPLDTVGNGGVIQGLTAVFQQNAGPNTVHLVGYHGGTPVVQSFNSTNAPFDTLSISYPGPGKLDSIVVWGFSFQALLWRSILQYEPMMMGGEAGMLKFPEISPIRKEGK
jgi:hypothetical protein